MKVLMILTVFLLGGCAGLFGKKEKVSPGTVTDLILNPLTATAADSIENRDCSVELTQGGADAAVGKEFGVLVSGEKTVSQENIFAHIMCTKMKRFLTVILIPEKKDFVRFLFPDYSLNEEAAVLTLIPKLFPSEVYDSVRSEWTADYPTGKHSMIFIFSKENPKFLRNTAKSKKDQILLDNRSIEELRTGLVKKIAEDREKDKSSHFIEIKQYSVTEKKNTDQKEINGQKHNTDGWEIKK